MSDNPSSDSFWHRKRDQKLFDEMYLPFFLQASINQADSKKHLRAHVRRPVYRFYCHRHLSMVPMSWYLSLNLLNLTFCEKQKECCLEYVVDIKNTEATAAFMMKTKYAGCYTFY